MSSLQDIRVFTYVSTHCFRCEKFMRTSFKMDFQTRLTGLFLRETKEYDLCDACQAYLFEYPCFEDLLQECGVSPEDPYYIETCQIYNGFIEESRQKIYRLAIRSAPIAEVDEEVKGCREIADQAIGEFINGTDPLALDRSEKLLQKCTLPRARQLLEIIINHIKRNIKRGFVKRDGYESI